ncbi:MAG: PLP-dependent aminotransferase family protein [Bacteroidia bacterium]
MNTGLDYTLMRIREGLSQVQKDQGHPVPRYVLLYQVIKKAIQDHYFPVAWILPGTRALASGLGWSRTTIIRTYELLELEHLVQAKGGSGYRVTDTSVWNQRLVHKVQSTADTLEHLISQQARQYQKSKVMLQGSPSGNSTFWPGMPPVDIFPINRWKNLLNNYWRYIKASSLNYSPSSGDALFKIKIAQFLRISRGIVCEPDQIMIVSGSVQSIYLLAHTLVNPGEGVVIENPGFPNVMGIFQGSGARVIGVGCDKEGLSISELQVIDYKADSPIKLLHVTPACQYPLGMTMGIQRRQQILEWCYERDCLILENDYEHEISNRGHPIPPLFNLDNRQRTIYLGTFNRLLYPSIRLGFMVVPASLVPALEAMQAHSHRFVSPYLQEVMGQFIDKNYLYSHLKTLGVEAKNREDVFRRHFPLSSIGGRWLQEGNSKSLHLTLAWGEESGASTLYQESKAMEWLNKAGLTAQRLSACYLPETTPNGGLVLGYASVNTGEIRRKLATLASIKP